MKIALRLVFFTVFTAALLAPFTFNQPDYTQIGLSDVGNSKRQSPVLDESLVVLPEHIEDKLHEEYIPNFAAIADVNEKKRAFFDYLRPVVVKQNSHIKQLRVNLKQLRKHLRANGDLTSAQKLDLEALARYYRVNKKLSFKKIVDTLLYQVDVLPVDLVLVQAANESAWGTSRFARIGLNFFGLWCYQKGCGMVPNGRESGATHEVEKFDTLEGAVARYFRYINASSHYKQLRRARAEFREANTAADPAVLASGLTLYSARGDDYVTELQDMLRHNEHLLLAE